MSDSPQRQIWRSPDVKPVDPALEKEQAAAINAGMDKAKTEGQQGPFQAVAYPKGSPPPDGDWTYAGDVQPEGSSQKWDVYTRPRPQTIEFEPEEITAEPPPKGQEALKDTDKFSSTESPDNTAAECAVAFAEGFVEGMAIGFALAALGPLGLAIGLGMLIYSLPDLYDMVQNWDKLTPQEKARFWGGVAGGLKGAKTGAKVRGPKKGPKGKEKPPSRKGAIPDEHPRNLQEQILMDQARAGEAAGTNQPIQGGPAKPLGDAPRLVDNYGGSTGDWVKMRGPENHVINGQKVEVHYFKNTKTGQAVEYKFKKQ